MIWEVEDAPPRKKTELTIRGSHIAFDHMIVIALQYYRDAVEGGLIDEDELDDLDSTDDFYDQTILLNGKPVATLRPLGDGEMRVAMHRGTIHEARMSWRLEDDEGVHPDDEV
jgi:hypothetical protein